MSHLFSLLKELAAAERRLAAGAFLFLRGDGVTSLFAVDEGCIHLRRTLEAGSELTLQRCEGPGLLAEASIFSASYHCDAVAAVPTRVLSIPKARILDRLGADRAFSEAWSAHLARQVQKARFRSEVLALRTVAERLDLWLAWGPDPLPPKGRWKDLAAEIGVSPEALYRELAARAKATSVGGPRPLHPPRPIR